MTRPIIVPIVPAMARAEFDRLESAIVDPQRALRISESGDSASDLTFQVPGASEPPD